MQRMGTSLEDTHGRALSFAEALALNPSRGIQVSKAITENASTKLTSVRFKSRTGAHGEKNLSFSLLYNGKRLATQNVAIQAGQDARDVQLSIARSYAKLELDAKQTIASEEGGGDFLDRHEKAWKVIAYSSNDRGRRLGRDGGP